MGLQSLFWVPVISNTSSSICNFKLIFLLVFLSFFFFSCSFEQYVKGSSKEQGHDTSAGKAGTSPTRAKPAVHRRGEQGRLEMPDMLSHSLDDQTSPQQWHKAKVQAMRTRLCGTGSGLASPRQRHGCGVAQARAATSQSLNAAPEQRAQGPLSLASQQGYMAAPYQSWPWTTKPLAGREGVEIVTALWSLTLMGQHVTICDAWQSHTKSSATAACEHRTALQLGWVKTCFLSPGFNHSSHSKCVCIVSHSQC